jgi:hypothetical protein
MAMTSRRFVRRTSQPDRLAALAARVCAIEADPTNPFILAALSSEIRDLADQQKRILSAQEDSRIQREAEARKAILEHPAHAEGLAAGRADAVRIEYGCTRETVHDRHIAYDAARADLEAECARISDPALSEAVNRILAAAVCVFQAEAALRDVVLTTQHDPLA